MDSMTSTIDPGPVETPPDRRTARAEFDRLAVITIQGGGIYGLNLLGQLSYLTEQLKIIPVAVAGNSAGSIVATLFWAGYTPWEIREVFAEMAAKRQLANLVGPFDPPESPFEIADFRKLTNELKQLVDRLVRDEAQTSVGMAAPKASRSCVVWSALIRRSGACRVKSLLTSTIVGASAAITSRTRSMN